MALNEEAKFTQCHAVTPQDAFLNAPFGRGLCAGMRFALVLLCYFILIGCSAQNESSELIGEWREDKGLTLASMNRSEIVTDEDRVVTKNPSFGNVVK